MITTGKWVYGEEYLEISKIIHAFIVSTNEAGPAKLNKNNTALVKREWEEAHPKAIRIKH